MLWSKATGFKFNLPEEEVTEMFDINTGFIEINYDLAHNIVFIGLKFADALEIPPHKDFKLTKFISKEDNEDVALVGVATGDEDGNPHLIVSKSGYETQCFSQLEKYAGDNYTWANADELDDEDEEDNGKLDSFEFDTLTT